MEVKKRIIQQAKKEVINDEIKNIDKFLERLKGYGCGYHKQLEKQMLNRIKLLKHHHLKRG